MSIEENQSGAVVVVVGVATTTTTTQQQSTRRQNNIESFDLSAYFISVSRMGVQKDANNAHRGAEMRT